MGKRQFEVAQPNGAFLKFDLKAQVSHVYLCPDCGFVVAAFFPYRNAGFGEYFIVEYVDYHTVIREEHLTEVQGDRMHKCGHCFWDYVQADTIREPI